MATAIFWIRTSARGQGRLSLSLKCRSPNLLGDGIHLSATDLVGHLNCRHLTSLDYAVARGALAKPTSFDPFLEIFGERGAIHEQAYVDNLKACGLDTVWIEGVDITASTAEQTLNAMRAGLPIVVQDALKNGRWSGRADILRRVEIPSGLGSWSYEMSIRNLLAKPKGDGPPALLVFRSALLRGWRQLSRGGDVR
ncbi:hypothetical protein MESS2_750015 [Mesorhizobium metallidurans STM 2683]|uniref:Uncharacterized protein n=1 Tax=Mesorhizobium metallidurans STM 2683 TaxID=1297569 RepID=M5F981_9HYPH|nr:hypothetical protein [Mesorhizobium metallidurans]CCV08466.1 hypothetical protein MESS2_750015 [Mesorhizobium metallidurans STM 2683]